MVLSSEYLAGLFDSEGSIGAKRTGNSGLTLVLTISNTSLPVLEEVRDTVGYGYFISKKAGTSEKTCYEWRTRDHQHVLDFIGRIKKHARIKREAMEKVEATIREHSYRENNGTLKHVDPEILVAFHEIMPLREIGRILGVHHKSVWRRLAI